MGRCFVQATTFARDTLHGPAVSSDRNCQAEEVTEEFEPKIDRSLILPLLFVRPFLCILVPSQLRIFKLFRSNNAMHKPSIERMVHRYLFPHPKSSDPSDFHEFVRKAIVPEVRNETARFYGSVNCLESQYPGLDYASRGHRLRLSQFKWHRRLFTAFDALRLTRKEIYDLCHWEGTKWAKDKYESDHNIVIRNTTWDGVVDAAPRKYPTISRGVYMETQAGHLVPAAKSYKRNSTMAGMDAASSHTDDDSEQDSVDGFVDRNADTRHGQPIRSPTDTRYRGGHHGISSAWDDWMKDATERGTIPSVSELGSSRRLAAYQAHIPAHYPFATPTYHFGPYSPAPMNFTPTSTPYHQAWTQPQYPPIFHYSHGGSSYSNRLSRDGLSRSFR